MSRSLTLPDAFRDDLVLPVGVDYNTCSGVRVERPLCGLEVSSQLDSLSKVV